MCNIDSRVFNFKILTKKKHNNKIVIIKENFNYSSKYLRERFYKRFNFK